MGSEKKKTKIQNDVEETLMNLVNDGAQDPSLSPIEGPDQAESHWEALGNLSISKNLEDLQSSTLIQKVRESNFKKEKFKNKSEASVSLIPKVNSSEEINNSDSDSDSNLDLESEFKFDIQKKPENDDDRTMLSELLTQQSVSNQESPPHLSQLNLKTFQSDVGDSDKTVIATQNRLLNQSEVVKSSSSDVDLNFKNEEELKRFIEIKSKDYEKNKQIKNSEPEPVIPLFVNKVVDDKIVKTEQLKIAHQKIEILEKEIEELRLDNEKLASAAKVFESKNNELLEIKNKNEKVIESLEIKNIEELKIFKNQLDLGKEEINDLKIKNRELENRLAQDVRLSKSRERELENRLELLKLEKVSLASSKDDLILKLKKDIDQLRYELDVFKKKNIDLQKNIDLNEDQIRRTIRALRLALTSLEVAEENKKK